MRPEMAVVNSLSQVENISKHLQGHVPAAMRAQAYMAAQNAGGSAEEAYGVLLAISLLQATPKPEVIEVVFTKSYSHTDSKPSAGTKLSKEINLII